jgi:hypothetical protein
LRAVYLGNDRFSEADQETNYPGLQVTILGGSDPNKDLNFISDQGLCKSIYDENDPSTVAQKYSGYPDYYSVWGYADPVPGAEGTVTKFYDDDSYVYSWLTMEHIVENVNAEFPVWVYWNLYDPWGNLVAHVADISNTYSYTPYYVSQGGWLPDWWTPSVTVRSPEGTDVQAACIPYARDDQTDGYANLATINTNVWPEWSCYAQFPINSSWADQGPCRIEVVTSLLPYQTSTGTQQPQIIFNQTFEVIRHPTVTTIYNPLTLAPFSGDVYAMYGQPFNFSVQTRAVLSGGAVTPIGTVTIQYSTDGGQSWVNDWEGYTDFLPPRVPSADLNNEPVTVYSFTADTPGDYLVRAVWSYEGIRVNPDLPGGYEGSTSDPVTLHVYQIPTNLTISLSPYDTGEPWSSTLTFGASVKISGYLSWQVVSSNDPQPPTYYATYSGLSDNVSIEYAYLNRTTGKWSDWYTLEITNSDLNGYYSYTWTPDQITSYALRVHFYGDKPFAEYYSEIVNVFVNPGSPTAVEIVGGAGAQVERHAGTVHFQATVLDVVANNYIGGNNCSGGAVEFYVSNTLVGADNDSNGDGIYEITWDPSNWTILGNQQWTAYFTGTPGGYADSMANSTIEIYRSQVDISIMGYPTPLIDLPAGTTGSYDVRFTAQAGAPDTYDITVTGLDPSVYTLSPSSLTLNPSGTAVGDASLKISMPPLTGATLMPDVPFNITANSTLDPLSSDVLQCTIKETYVTLLPTALQGGLAVYVSPKAQEPDMSSAKVVNGKVYVIVPFDVTVVNSENFNDTVTLTVNVAQIEAQYQASLSWFSWTSIQVFVPMNSSFTVGLTASIPASALPQSGQNFIRTFTVVANSTRYGPNSAVDSGMITSVGSGSDFEADVKVIPNNAVINTPGGQASYTVEVDSTSTELEKIHVTVRGASGLGFSWTSQDTTLAAQGTVDFGLDINYSGSVAGNIYFTVTVFTFPNVYDASLMRYWTLGDAMSYGQFESNSFTNYVQVTSGALGSNVPTVSLNIGETQYVDSDGNVYVTPATPFTLTAANSGQAFYMITNSTWAGNTILYSGPFNLTGLADGSYAIYYGNSTSTLTESQDVFLDSTPPTSTLSIGEPKYQGMLYVQCYVTSSTVFTLDADDAGSGVESISYTVILQGHLGLWHTYTGPFTITSQGDGTYYIYYRSTDNLGNVETTKSRIVILDDTPPSTTLSVSGPIQIGYNNYASSSTVFTLTATDAESGVATTSYDINSPSFDSGWILYSGPFNLTGLADGTYTINYNSTDKVGNVESTKQYIVITSGLDTIPPSTTIAISGPVWFLTSPPCVSSSTLFTLNASDNMGGTGISVTLYDIIGANYDSSWLTYKGPFSLKSLSDGTYTIYYASTDNAGNIEPTKYYDVTLDNTPPTTTLTIGTPEYVSTNTYVTSAASFTLSAVDAGSGTGLTCYLITGPNGYNSGWLNYSMPFYLNSLLDGQYVIYYYSVDNLGNVETPKTVTVILDDTAPITQISVGSPQYAANGNFYVSQSTLFTLSPSDSYGGSGVQFTFYMISNGTYNGGWTTYSTAFNLAGLTDGQWIVSYYSIDHLGNTETAKSIVVILDNTPPTTTLTIGTPEYVSTNTYVTSAASFTLSAVDAGSGTGLTCYLITGPNGYNSGWLNYSTPFNLGGLQDGQYTICYHSTDNLGNAESLKNETVILDNTPPTTTLTVVGPKIIYGGNTYVNSTTLFTLNASDGIGGSGVAVTAYRITGTSYDSGWLTSTGSFYLPTGLQKGAVYTIAFNSTDNLGNIEATKTVSIVIILHSVRVQITPVSTTVNTGQVATYSINVTNLGNVPDTYSLTMLLNDFGTLYKAYPTAIQASWTSLSTTSWSLNPSQSGLATFTVAIPASWSGIQDATYTFNATVTCQADPTVRASPMASVTVKATKLSGSQYTELETQWLENSVITSNIPSTVKSGLVLTLETTKTTLNLAMLMIGTRNTAAANLLLTAAQLELQVFILQVQNQQGKTIPLGTAQSLIQSAQGIQQDIQTAKSLS